MLKLPETQNNEVLARYDAKRNRVRVIRKIPAGTVTYEHLVEPHKSGELRVIRELLGAPFEWNGRGNQPPGLSAAKQVVIFSGSESAYDIWRQRFGLEPGDVLQQYRTGEYDKSLAVANAVPPRVEAELALKPKPNPKFKRVKKEKNQ